MNVKDLMEAAAAGAASEAAAGQHAPSQSAPLTGTGAAAPPDAVAVADVPHRVFEVLQIDGRQVQSGSFTQGSPASPTSGQPPVLGPWLAVCQTVSARQCLAAGPSGLGGGPQGDPSAQAIATRADLTPVQPLVTCGVCFDPFPADEMVTARRGASLAVLWSGALRPASAATAAPPPVPQPTAAGTTGECGHRMFTDCARHYVLAMLAERRFSLRCAQPGCDAQLAGDDVRSLLRGDAQHAKGLQVYGELEAQHDPTRRTMYCPYPKCSVLLTVGLPKEAPDQTWTCSTCNRAFCASCAVPTLHEGLTCAQFQALPLDQRAPEDVDALKAATMAAGWKRCPGCSRIVEKTDGCNFVTCRCGVSFCYRCRSTAALQHSSKELTRDKFVRNGCVNAKVYTHTFNMLHQALGVNRKIDLQHLVVQFGCASVRQSVVRVLDLYKQRFLAKLPEADKRHASFARPVFLAVAFSLVARKNKIKVDQRALLETMCVGRDDFLDISASMYELCFDVVGVEKTKAKAAARKTHGAVLDGHRPQVEDASSDEETGTSGRADGAPGGGATGRPAGRPRAGVKRTRKQQEEYDEWKLAVLMGKGKGSSCGGAGGRSPEAGREGEDEGEEGGGGRG